VITFKTFLFELADSEIPFTVEKDVPGLYIANATIDDKKIRFVAGEDEYDEWAVSFTTQAKGRLPSHGLTGAGGQFQIAAFVVSALQDLVQKHDPLKISFYADKDNGSDTRSRVYEKMLKRKLPNFEIAAKYNDVEEDMSLYVLKKKKQKVDEVADKKVEYKITGEGPTNFRASAIINGRKIRFSASDSGDPDEGWDILFTETKPGDSWTTVATGSGGEFEVAAFIVAAMKEFITRYEPQTISFTAEKAKEFEEGNTRAAVYRRLLKRHFPEYDIEERTISYGRTAVMYMRRK
jgi:hypothetical protein